MGRHRYCKHYGTTVPPLRIAVILIAIEFGHAFPGQGPGLGKKVHLPWLIASRSMVRL